MSTAQSQLYLILPLSKMICFIIDDSEDFCRRLRHTLRKNYAQTVHMEVQFDSAISKLSKMCLEDDAPDVVFVDYDLKEHRNGVDFISQAQRFNSLSAYILITDTDDEAAILRAKNLGALHIGKSKVSDGELIRNTSLHAISQLSQQRKEALKQIKDQRKRVFKLSAHIAHEMRGIVHGIANSTRALYEESKFLEFHDVIKESTDDILDQINEADYLCETLLKYTGRNKLRIIKNEVVIFDFMNAIFNSKHDLELKIEYRDIDRKCRFCFDDNAIKRIFNNIVSNVKNHCNEKRLAVTIDRFENSGIDFLSVDFCDFGPGIDKKYWNSIFEPGDRGPKEIDYRDGTGFGYGLSFSRELARAHNYSGLSGDLRLCDVEDPFGTCFRLEIPGTFK